MMRVKFNKFERIAGLFVLGAFLGFMLMLVSIAYKQSWFDSKVGYDTYFLSGDGIHAGTIVQISGLRAGEVQAVELTQDNRVQVKFSILSKFQPKIRADSIVELVRPFIIGERILDISVGTPELPPLAENATMKSKETMDLMSLMGGKNIGQYLESLSGMASSLKLLVEAFSNEERTKSFIQMFDRIAPLLKNLNTMSVEVIKLSKAANKNDRLGVVLSELAFTTKELNSMIPQLKAKAPKMAEDLSLLVANLTELSTQFKAFVPAIAAVAPDLPKASRRAIEALDEAVVLMKAMQRSFLVKGGVKEVREEEEAREKRKPADE